VNRPTFFLSSTIYDLGDLRSALKYYLEQQGCRVLASECNDFQKSLDKHSYQECLDAIGAADYFILVIGSRVGGWYDEASRVSITQKEYREAYRLHQEGKLKIFSFVRASVWQAKDDRRELEKFLESISLEEGLSRRIKNFPSKSVQDAEFISNFIAEVGRNRETKAAVSQGGAPPTGNWIHVFSDFRDIVRVIDGHLFAATPVEDLILTRLLRRELRTILARALIKWAPGRFVSPQIAVEKFHKETPLKMEDRERKHTDVESGIWDQLSMISISLLGMRLHTVVLDRAITQSTFLHFDQVSNSFRETPVYEALLQLQDEIRRLIAANTAEVLSVVYENSRRTRGHVEKLVRVDTLKFGQFLNLLDRWVNVVQLTRALLQHFDGGEFSLPRLRPISPILGMSEQMAKETVTDSELDQFIATREKRV
jgi:hypothetical protein